MFDNRRSKNKYQADKDRVVIIENGKERLRACYADSLSAVFINNGFPDWEKPGVTQLIRLSLLTQNPSNNRTFVSGPDMDSLRAGVKAIGIHTPLKIAMRLEGDDIFLLKGHRRSEAAAYGGFELVPCKLDPRVRLNDSQMFDELFGDNEGKVNKAPIDRADGYKRVMDALNLGEQEIAKRLSINIQTLKKYLKLLELPTPVQELINNNKLGVGHGYWIAQHKGGPEAQIKLANEAVETGASAKVIERIVGRSGGRVLPKPNRANPKNKEVREGTNRVWVIPGAKVSLRFDRTKLTSQGARELVAEALASVPVQMPVHHLQSKDTSVGNAANPKRTSAFTPEYLDRLAKSRQVEASPRHYPGTRIVEPAQSGSTLPNSLKPAPFTPVQPIETPIEVINAPYVKVYKGRDRELRACAAQSVQAEFFGGTPNWERTDVTQLLNIKLVANHPYDTRKNIDDVETFTLKEAIRAVGIHTPLKVCMGPNPEWTLVIGGRRRRDCAHSLGFQLVPCELDRRMKLEPHEMIEAMVADQEGSSPLMPIDRAMGYEVHMRQHGTKAEETARLLCVEPTIVKDHLELLSLPSKIQEMLNNGALSYAQGRAFIGLAISDEQKASLAIQAADQELSVNKIKEIASRFGTGIRVRTDLDKKFTKTSFLVGSERRGNISIQADDESVDESKVREILEKVLADIDAGVDLAPELEIKPDLEGLLPLATFVKGNVKILSLINERHLDGIFIEKEQGLMLTQDIARALNVPLVQNQLKRMGLIASPETFAYTQMWGNIKEPTVTALQVIAYWAWCIERLERKGSKLLTEHELNEGPLDTVLQAPISALKIKEEIIQALKRAPNIIRTNLLSLAGGEELHAAISSSAGIGKADEMFVRASELAAAGIETRGYFCTRFNRHLFFQKNKSQSQFGVAGADLDKLNLAEVEQYLSHCILAVQQLTGGSTVGKIGKKQIAEKCIPYYPPGGQDKQLYPAADILRQLSNSVDNLQKLINGLN